MIMILKYPIPATGGALFTLELPRGSRAIHVAEQTTPNGSRCSLWAEVDTTEPTTSHRFQIVGTGQRVRQRGSYRYVGTFTDVEYIWHLYAEHTEE